MAGVKPLLETIGALMPRIKAWHVSPYDFDKFDLSKIGTGQGAASFGEGIYKAESPKVSGVGGEYWDEFARHPEVRNKSPEMPTAITYLETAGHDRDKAIEIARRALEQDRIALDTGFWTPGGKPMELPDKVNMGWLVKQRENALRLLEDRSQQVGPRVYEVGIHAKPEQILDWDAPLSKQPSKPIERLQPNVRDIIEMQAENRGVNSMIDVPEAYTGKDLHRTLHDPEVSDEIWSVLGGKQRPLDERPGMLVMDYLNAIDLPVTRYLDQHSRSRVAPKSYYDALATAKSRLWQAEQKGAPQWELQHLKQSVDEADARVRREKEAFPQTRNYVTRDTDFLEILRKLAIPGMVGGAATAYQPQGSP